MKSDYKIKDIFKSIIKFTAYKNDLYLRFN